MGFADAKRGSAALAGAIVCVAGLTLPGRAATGTVERITQSKTVRIAYREDAPPFSYKDSLGEPAGYMVDLCKAVAQKLKQDLNIPSLSVTYMPVTAVNRFEAIQQTKADLLCEPTSATLSRRELVDFSISTYIDGAGLMIRSDGPKAMQAMAGQKVGVLAGTTTEAVLRNYVKDAGISVDIVPAKTHAEGVGMLDAGAISAYFADRSILESLIKESKAPQKLMIANDYLTVEPYALALLHGDEEFRLAVDRALSHIYRSGEIGPIFEHTFSDRARQSPIMQSLYLISGLPD
jgi:ABC-type amino acid transport substrate-binding protein